MSPALLKIHNECVELCQAYMTLEPKIVAKLQLVARHRIYRELKKKNLFVYATEVCGLSPSQAYTFTSLAKKSNEHPELASAIRDSKLSISKAARIVSVIQNSNAQRIVQFAQTHTSREIEREVRRINPKAAEPQKISILAEKVDLLHCPIDPETSDYIRKSQAIIAQKTKSHKDLSQTIHIVFKDFYERHDPVKKAERVKARREQKTEVAVLSDEFQNNSARAENTGNDQGLRAAEVHAVNLRDHRKCRQTLESGERCNEDRWIDYHHIIPRKNGGSNHPDNLITLCWFHHNLIHRHEMELLPFKLPGPENRLGEKFDGAGESTS